MDKIELTNEKSEEIPKSYDISKRIFGVYFIA